MSLKKKFDIVVLSENDGRIKNYTLSSTIIKLVLLSNIFLIILFVISLLFSIYFYKEKILIESASSSRIERIDDLKKVNNKYREMLGDYVNNFNNINKRLHLAEYLSSKILYNVNIDESEKRFLDNVDNDFSLKNVTSTKEELEFYETMIDFIDKESLRIEKKLAAIYSLYQKNKDLLLSTPSIWPVRGWLSSYFGKRTDPFTGKEKFHDGLDIANNPGLPIKATADGIVIFAGERGGYGNVVVIRHNETLETRYAHMQAYIVKVGQKIKKAETIGFLGNTGRSSGPHLHYEVRKNAVPVNPMNYILE